ncbi:MAG: hypothetical protein Kow0045_04570 [Albidovulum sp.]
MARLRGARARRAAFPGKSRQGAVGIEEGGNNARLTVVPCGVFLGHRVPVFPGRGLDQRFDLGQKGGWQARWGHLVVSFKPDRPGRQQGAKLRDGAPFIQPPGRRPMVLAQVAGGSLRNSEETTCIRKLR